MLVKATPPGGVTVSASPPRKLEPRILSVCVLEEAGSVAGERLEMCGAGASVIFTGTAIVCAAYPLAEPDNETEYTPGIVAGLVTRVKVEVADPSAVGVTAAGLHPVPLAV